MAGDYWPWYPYHVLAQVPNYTSPIQAACGFCQQWHTGPCPKVKKIEYQPNGQIKAIEYHEPYSEKEDGQ